jgi:hypothetical protein
MSSKKIIKVLFADDPARQYRAQVIARLTAGRWRVRDEAGRLAIVTSDQEWRPGLDWVNVQAGRIVGRAAIAATINVYEV